MSTWSLLIILKLWQIWYCGRSEFTIFYNTVWLNSQHGSSSFHVHSIWHKFHRIVRWHLLSTLLNLIILLILPELLYSINDHLFFILTQSVWMGFNQLIFYGCITIITIDLRQRSLNPQTQFFFLSFVATSLLLLLDTSNYNTLEVSMLRYVYLTTFMIIIITAKIIPRPMELTITIRLFWSLAGITIV